MKRMTVEYKNLTVKSKIVKKIFKGCIIKSDNIKIIAIVLLCCGGETKYL